MPKIEHIVKSKQRTDTALKIRWQLDVFSCAIATQEVMYCFHYIPAQKNTQHAHAHNHIYADRHWKKVTYKHARRPQLMCSCLWQIISFNQENSNVLVICNRCLCPSFVFFIQKLFCRLRLKKLFTISVCSSFFSLLSFKRWLLWLSIMTVWPMQMRCALVPHWYCIVFALVV